MSMWESERDFHSAGGGSRDYGNGTVDRQGRVKTDGFIHKDQSWYVSTDIPSDLLVKVGDANFHLHKYPLLSRSVRMNRIIYESSRHVEVNPVELDDIPGGADSFELVAKFCYGIAVDLTASNISGLRCAAEYLEMTEDFEEGNLIFKTEAFLSYVVLASWRDSIVVLKSCESLSPWAENLQIVRRCSESIAWKACANPRGIRWAYTGKPPKPSSSSPKWQGTGCGGQSLDSSPARNPPPPDWWFEDVTLLRIDHFVRVITAIKVKGMRFELIGAAIMQYANKWLPGMSNAGPSIGGEEITWNGQSGLHMVMTDGGCKEETASTSNAKARDQRMVIESLISIVPAQKDSVSCAFLLRILRLASMLKVAPALVTEVEKRVGMQLEQANVSDLLIPSYGRGEAMYDVDLVQRLVEHFLVQEQGEAAPPSPPMEGYDDGSQRGGAPSAKTRVARLLDSYLTEVSRDRNLSLTTFQVLTEALPESARSCDDGLYRAVDSYLKAHPMLTEHERKRLCRVMDCQKLSIDACMHAAQNERLPLRVVVQVLFSEQVKISNALATSSLQKDAGHSHHHHPPVISTRKQLLEGTPQSFQEGWAAATKDITTLKFELESMKAKYLELQNDMDTLQRMLEKVSTAAAKPPKHSGWSSGWKKLSKLGKNTGVEGNEMGAEQTRKGQRKWRNSIS